MEALAAVQVRDDEGLDMWFGGVALRRVGWAVRWHHSLPPGGTKSRDVTARRVSLARGKQLQLHFFLSSFLNLFPHVTKGNGQFLMTLLLR